MLYDFVIWAGRRSVRVDCRLASASCLHRSVWHGRSRSAAHRAAPAPPAVHQRRVTTLPAACRTGAAPAPGLVAPPVLARRAGTRRGPRWLPRARRDAHERRILAPPRLPGSRATAPRPVSTPRPRRVRAGPASGTVERFRLYRSIYTLSRSRRSNMQPARDHLNSITVVCASPRRAAPLRLHRPHVARVYRTTGDHRTHYLIKSRSEPKRPPRG